MSRISSARLTTTSISAVLRSDMAMMTKATSSSGAENTVDANTPCSCASSAGLSQQQPGGNAAAGLRTSK